MARVKLTPIHVAGIVVSLVAVMIYLVLRPQIEYEPRGGGNELKLVRVAFSPEGGGLAACELYYKTPNGQHVPLCAYLGVVYVDKEFAIYTCDSQRRIFVARRGTSATDVTEAVLRYGYGFKQIGKDASESLERSGGSVSEFEKQGDQIQVKANVGNDFLNFSIPLQQIELFSGLN